MSNKSAEFSKLCHQLICLGIRFLPLRSPKQERQTTRRHRYPAAILMWDHGIPTATQDPWAPILGQPWPEELACAGLWLSRNLTFWNQIGKTTTNNTTRQVSRCHSHVRPRHTYCYPGSLDTYFWITLAGRTSLCCALVVKKSHIL